MFENVVTYDLHKNVNPSFKTYTVRQNLAICQ